MPGRARRRSSHRIVVWVTGAKGPVVHAYHALRDLTASKGLRFLHMDVIHGLTLSEIHPDAVTTAYGPLADRVAIARGGA